MLIGPMSSYKLYYFEARAVGEPIRFLLSYMGIPFEDFRFSYDEWLTKWKFQMPFGKAPALEVNGKLLHQSIAICRFLGKQAAIAGNNDFEELEIDMIVDTFQDFRLEISKYYFEKDKEKKEKLKYILLNEVIPFYMNKFEEIINENGGYIANRTLSWGDLYIAAFSDTLSDLMNEDIFGDKYPNFTKMKESIHAIPSIKAWVDKRPKTFC